VCNVAMDEGKKYEIIVKVHTTYLPEQSDEALDRYVFAYTIVLSNTGTVPAQLISRHWIIADGSGGVQEVRGLGVVGEQNLS
jgi:ApaG protein